MVTETIELCGGGEISEVTAALRWVPETTRLGLNADFQLRKKLQQAHRIYVVDKDGRRMGSRTEWRDVPTEMNPAAD